MATNEIILKLEVSLKVGCLSFAVGMQPLDPCLHADAWYLILVCGVGVTEVKPRKLEKISQINSTAFDGEKMKSIWLRFYNSFLWVLCINHWWPWAETLRQTTFCTQRYQWFWFFNLNSNNGTQCIVHRAWDISSGSDLTILLTLPFPQDNEQSDQGRYCQTNSETLWLSVMIGTLYLNSIPVLSSCRRIYKKKIKRKYENSAIKRCWGKYPTICK